MNGTTARGYITSYDGAPLGFGSSTLRENSVANQFSLGVAVISSGSQQVFNLGTLQNSDTQSLSSGTSSSLRIGAYSAEVTVDFFSGDVAEMIVFTVALTTAQRQQIEGYLARKWGISSNLPTTHLYRSIPIVTRAFQPIDIPDCALWLDGADRSTFSLTGTNINSWSDKTSNISFTASSTKPTIYSSTYNGLNPVYFGGSAYLSNGTFSYQLSNRSAFIVCGEVSRTGNGDLGFMSFANSGNDYDRSNAIAYTNGWAPNGKYFAIQAGVYGAVTGGFDATFGSATPTPFAVVGDTFSSGTETVYENGTQRVTSNVGVAFSNSTGLVLGARYLNGSITSNINGVIAEIALFNRALSSSERRQVEGYLATKWGLRTNLPSTHPFKLVPAVTPPFTPLQISGCQLWLDAADRTTLTLSGSNVTQWNDKSGNGYNASGGISPAYSNSGVVFDGSTMSLLTSYTAQPTTETILLVCSFNASASVGGFPLGTTIHGGRSVNMGYSSGTVTVMWDKLGYWGNASSSASISAGTRFLTTMVLYNATNASTSLNAANQSSIATFPNSFFGGGTTRIGAALTSGSLYAPFYGTINEIVVYNSALSRSQYQQLEGYLAAKWGLKSSLPTTHPFKVITP
jgi:hypothetical protein